MGLKIGILGTRGIPNQYGGFEQVAEHLSTGLMAKGHEVIVYNSHKHPYQQKTWNGVPIIHCYDPEYILGTAGQFIYDLNCILDARKRSFDILLLLGYTSSSVWKILYPKKSIIISNMDGMEWQRAKYSKSVRKFLMYAEKLAVKGSDYHIADSPVIKTYLDEKYHINAKYIAYGADLSEHEDENILTGYGLSPKEYFLLVARMEPENNIEMLLDGFHMSRSQKKFVVVGNMSNKYGQYLFQKFSNDKRIIFPGAIFDQEKLQSIVKFSCVYFHGHSVGGTNPSLLEAMADGAFIAAHNNPFNKSILQNNALYFSQAQEVCTIISQHEELFNEAFIRNNLESIRNNYTWEKIVAEYDLFFSACFQRERESVIVSEIELGKQLINAE